ncbi:hypothetical protein R6Z07M_011238 [Ovis aries]
MFISGEDTGSYDHFHPRENQATRSSPTVASSFGRLRVYILMRQVRARGLRFQGSCRYSGLYEQHLQITLSALPYGFLSCLESSVRGSLRDLDPENLQRSLNGSCQDIDLTIWTVFFNL